MIANYALNDGPECSEMISNKDITNTVIVFCNENNYLFSALGLIFIVASDERTASVDALS